MCVTVGAVLSFVVLRFSMDLTLLLSFTKDAICMMGKRLFFLVAEYVHGNPFMLYALVCLICLQTNENNTC